MSARVLVALLILVSAVGPEVIYYQLITEVVAEHFDMNRDYMCCVAQKESNWNPKAYNHAEAAAGLFQWREESWVLARNAMGVDADLELRFDPIANIVTAGYAMQREWDWWVTAKALCQSHLDRDTDQE